MVGLLGDVARRPRPARLGAAHARDASRRSPTASRWRARSRNSSAEERSFETNPGPPPSLARAVWLAAWVSLLVSVALVGREGDERTAFVLAITAALALSPIVWLHYFTILLVAVAVAQPRLGAAWFAPLAMYVATGHGNPTSFETTTTLAAAALTVTLSVIAMRDTGEGRPAYAVPPSSTAG